MISVKNKKAIKDDEIYYDFPKSTEQRGNKFLIVKKVSEDIPAKTRICKDYPSIYVMPRSREIKKWFETRRV